MRQFKNANWEAIRQQIRSCWTSFSKNSPSRSVNDIWLKLKSILNQCLDKFIPTKMTSPRANLPWLSKSLLASIRKKTSLLCSHFLGMAPDPFGKKGLDCRSGSPPYLLFLWCVCYTEDMTEKVIFPNTEGTYLH